jgi:PAS domain S-box-containing protein
MMTPATREEPPHDDPRDDLVLAECVRLLYVRCLVILSLMTAGGAVFALAFSHTEFAHRLPAWVAAVTATSLARLLLSRRYLSRPRLPAEARRWARLYAWGALSSGVVFGLAGVLLFVPGSLADQSFLALLLAGVAGSAIAANSIYVPGALAFAVPALSPFVGRVILEGGRPQIAMALAVAFFAASMATIGRTAARAIRDSVRLRFGNEALAEHYRREVVEHRGAAQALRESEALFRDLAERAVVGVYVIREGRFLYVNPRMEEIFGYAPGELRNRASADTVHPDDRATVAENIRKRLASEELAMQYQFRGVRKSGETCDIEVFGTRTTFGGCPAIVGTLVDITDRKLAEQERIRIQKVESLGVLAGGIAHDFNNLLAAILGSISVAREGSSTDSLQLEVLTEAEEAAVRASELTRQLLTFSRGGEPVKRSLAVESVLRSSTSFAVRGSRVVAQCDVPADLWRVNADEGQIAQVIHNLVLNAVQAMPEGGTVRLSAENVPEGAALPAGLAPARRYVRISVADEGPGIDPAVVHKIFDPYFTTKATGTGLGLATAHSIVRRHSGHVSVESEPSRGATFQVYLPASQGDASFVVDRPAKLALGRGRVAVMDDDELVRKSAVRVLARLGFEAVAARDGAELLSLCEAARESGRPFDAAILDLTVPGGMGGKEAVALLRQREPGVRAIVSSGYSSDPVMADHAHYGFAGVIAKPYRLEDMGAVLDRVLDARRES